MRPKPAAPAEAPGATLDVEARCRHCSSRCLTWRPPGCSASAPVTRPPRSARQDRRLPTALVTTPEHVAGQGGFTGPEMQAALPIEWVDLRVPSPFSLPLMVERFRKQLSTAKLQDRLRRRLADAGRGLDAPVPAGRRRLGTQSAA